MSIEIKAYCLYGYYTTINKFEDMIDLTGYNHLFDWIDDWNRYEWCVCDDNYVYFGIPINYSTNPMSLQSKWEKFKFDILEKHINLNLLQEDRPHFQVFAFLD